MAWDESVYLQNERWEQFMFFKSAATTIAESIAPGRVWKLQEIRLYLSNSFQSIETMTLNLSAGKGSYYNVNFISHPFSGSYNYLYFPSVSDMRLFQSDDQLVISLSNSGGTYYGLVAIGWAVVA